MAKKTDISLREEREPSWLSPFCFQSLCQVMLTGCSTVCRTDVRVVEVEVFSFNSWQESEPVFLPKPSNYSFDIKKATHRSSSSADIGLCGALFQGTTCVDVRDKTVTDDRHNVTAGAVSSAQSAFRIS